MLKAKLTSSDTPSVQPPNPYQAPYLAQGSQVELPPYSAYPPIAQHPYGAPSAAQFASTPSPQAIHSTPGVPPPRPRSMAPGMLDPLNSPGLTGSSGSLVSSTPPPRPRTGPSSMIPNEVASSSSDYPSVPPPRPGAPPPPRPGGPPPDLSSHPTNPEAPSATSPPPRPMSVPETEAPTLPTAPEPPPADDSDTSESSDSEAVEVVAEVIHSPHPREPQKLPNKSSRAPHDHSARLARFAPLIDKDFDKQRLYTVESQLSLDDRRLRFVLFPLVFLRL